MDSLTKEERSWNMSRIRGRDTAPERAVRSFLHRAGYRFRIQDTKLFGKPDIVLPRYRTVVLVHGCFWHRHSGCQFAYSPKTRTDFWQAKFKATELRDRRVKKELERSGWQVVTVWECELRDPERLIGRLKAVLEVEGRSPHASLSGS